MQRSLDEISFDLLGYLSSPHGDPFHSLVCSQVLKLRGGGDDERIFRFGNPYPAPMEQQEEQQEEAQIVQAVVELPELELDLAAEEELQQDEQQEEREHNLQEEDEEHEGGVSRPDANDGMVASEAEEEVAVIGGGSHEGDPTMGAHEQEDVDENTPNSSAPVAAEELEDDWASFEN